MLLALALTVFPKILVTSFDPFGGDSANNTQAIAQELKDHTRKLGLKARVVVCNLPVVYDQAAEVARRCIAKEKPDLVVSLGEAGCSLRLESAATNWDSDGEDNAKQNRNGSKITENGPERVGFHFPVASLYCGLPRESVQDVKISHSPGAFVCNNVSYHLALELPRKLPFTFIHVPNSECSADQRNPWKNAWLIARMLRAAKKSGNFRTRMPATRDEAEHDLAQLQARHAPACQLEYGQKLVQSY